MIEQLNEALRDAGYKVTYEYGSYTVLDILAQPGRQICGIFSTEAQLLKFLWSFNGIKIIRNPLLSQTKKAKV